MLPRLFVLGNRKGSNFTTQVLADQLVRDGVPAYPVVPSCLPRFNPRRVKLVVNDGVSGPVSWGGRLPHDCKWLNTQSAVRTSSFKTEMFEALQSADVPSLKWTTDRETAQGWGKPVVVRNRIAGARGQGIQIVQPDEQVPSARLYTELFTGKYVKEYRVYVVDGKVIDIVQKMRLHRDNLIARGINPDDELKKIVRTHGNGWVFARNSWERRDRELEIVNDVALRAAQACGLGYGGVDLAVRRWKNREPDVVVVETNTHLGLDGTTLRNLSQAIKEVYDES